MTDEDRERIRVYVGQLADQHFAEAPLTRAQLDKLRILFRREPRADPEPQADREAA